MISTANPSHRAFSLHRHQAGSALCCALAILLLSLTHLPGQSHQESLRAALDPLIAAFPQGALAAVAVYDIDAHRFIYHHQLNSHLRLASVAKVPVSAAALLELGPKYRFTTTLTGLGPISEQGSIPGLGVIAGGDPCLDEHHTDGQPDRIFQNWAAQLDAAGVQRIDGDLVIDSSLFDGPIRPPTYPRGQRNIQAWYSAPASAFAWNDNCIEVKVTPTAVGQPVRVHTRPRSARIPIRNRGRTVAEKPSAGLVVSRHHASNEIIIGGRYTLASSWFPLAIHQDPDLLAGDHLAALLEEHGITVSGSVRLGTVRPEHILHQHFSPLLSALAILNQRSQNFYGEQIIRILGHGRYGAGSISNGTRAVSAILADHLGLPAAHLQLLDGSGLSYDNRSSPWYICQMLARMRRHQHGDFYASTLRERWVEGARCQVKTGTLAVVRSLAGYINLDDRRYSFTILLNRGDSDSIAWARHTRDRLLKATVSALK